ncbi:acyl-CoA desaturase [Psychrobacter phenylpyruvicus]|uniref:acyl-CoA desaturase n=1 Tax=Psychrobacter phenylpyruvicus TaxID=29432 RepID=UPI00048E81D1|nr:fatty acid desaturase [Psychrobacter phenylpyruvicus]
MAKELAFKRAPINWIPAAVLVATPIAAALITPWYLATHKVSAPVWLTFGAVGVWTGLSITAGYHRLMSHRAYKAHPAVRNFFLVGATLAVQGSAFDWCSGHRTHHRHVDDPMDDPYSAKRGFWFSHIGWMLKNYPSGNFDYKNIPDLTKDKVLQIQHKYYGAWVVVANVGLIGAIGWLIGDVWGTLLLAGLVRLVINHHFTFFINSLCHMIGTRPYTDTNTARDNFLLAIPTWGEGYHNYHHFFQYDYRNGVKWWQYDPTKWLIAALEKVGLASDLRTVDDATIKHAEVNMMFKRAQNKIAKFSDEQGLITDSNLSRSLQNFSDRVHFEYQLFNETVKEWQALKAKAIQLKKTEFAERLHEVDEALKDQYQMIEKRILKHNHNLKQAFKEISFKTA